MIVKSSIEIVILKRIILHLTCSPQIWEFYPITNRQNLTYTYNNDGNITTITDAVNSNQVQTFGYDDARACSHHPLTSAVTSAVGSGQYTTQSYTYDPETGNLEMKGSLSLDYEQNQQPTAPYHGVKSSSNGNTYAYDANGNMTTRIIGTTTYTLVFDVANRLVEVKTNGVTSAQMIYDGDGNRVKTVISGMTTTYIGNYFETNGTTIKKYYYYGSTRVAMRSGSTLYFLLSDHLGSTTMFLNSSGGRVTELLYSPWGENRFTYGLAPSTFQYTGQRNDSVAGGLYYYGARYFDSAIGRFISADTVVPGAGNAMAWDRYAYTFNSPVNYSDPNGHQPCRNGRTDCKNPRNYDNNPTTATPTPTPTLPRDPIPFTPYSTPTPTPDYPQYLAITPTPYPDCVASDRGFKGFDIIVDWDKVDEFDLVIDGIGIVGDSISWAGVPGKIAYGISEVAEILGLGYDAYNSVTNQQMDGLLLDGIEENLATYIPDTGRLGGFGVFFNFVSIYLNVNDAVTIIDR